MGATSEWTVPSADFPMSAGPEEKLAFAVKHALLASAELRWPSWDYRIAAGLAELVARNSPLVEAMDGEGRETMIGCGISLQLFKLTLRHLGCLGRVELFPNLDRPLLAARIHLGHGGERDSIESRLFEAISRNGLPAPVNESLLWDTAAHLLERSAEAERGWLEFARSETTRDRLHTLAIQPQRLVVEEVSFRNAGSKELSHHEPGSRRSRGASLFKRLSRWKKPQLVVKVGSSSDVSHGPGESSATTTLPGTFAVLKTKTDDKHGWLAAGQAMARLILQARASGVSCNLHNESLRSAQVRTALRTEIGRKGFVQAILRFGLESRRISVEPMLPCYQTPSIDQSTFRPPQLGVEIQP